MRKHLKYLRQQKGLTLVELLAVLVILGIVAVIAVPMIGNIIQDSKDKATINDALNIISAAKLAESNGDFDFRVATNKVSTADLKSKKYLDIDESYDDVEVYKQDTKGWTLDVNEDIKKAVKNLSDNNHEANTLTEKQLLQALDKKTVTTQQ